jgi:glycosyltransferase A (GT-A) superfamily protein (DUF2064 family)
MTTLVLIAKEPLPGKAKTRLHPPLTLEQAARIAAACIDDTIAVINSVAATRRILFFGGQHVPLSADGFEILAQPPGTLDERLGWLFDYCTEPTVLVGMDTPQLTARHLAPMFPTWTDEVDAWFGPAADGGFWCLGMREPRGDLVRGVVMSRDDTGDSQLARLASAGLRVGRLDKLTDVDVIADAITVASGAPQTRFAHELRSAMSTLPPACAPEG